MANQHQNWYFYLSYYSVKTHFACREWALHAVHVHSFDPRERLNHPKVSSLSPIHPRSLRSGFCLSLYPYIDPRVCMKAMCERMAASLQPCWWKHFQSDLQLAALQKSMQRFKDRVAKKTYISVRFPDRNTDQKNNRPRNFCVKIFHYWTVI